MMAMAKRLVRSAVLRSPALQSFLDRFALRFVAGYSNLYEGRWDQWWRVDQIFTACRRQLVKCPAWRYGPQRVHEVAKEAYDSLASYASVEGKVYCDLGCGSHHPYGSSAVFYINGAAAAVATDLTGTDAPRAAEALFDLLTECAANPGDWHWSGVGPDFYWQRLRQFNLHALRHGDLQAGLVQIPLRHVVTDIYAPSLAENSFDLMSSRAVLEHFLDFERGAARLLALMKPGGVACHLIDLVDHRVYVDPGSYHYWSFLAEDEGWSDGLVNRLRSSELRLFLEKAGFEILRYECRQDRMPEGFRACVKGRFARMSDDDLNTITVRCVLRKPSG